ncbi:MAG TPA: hydantoinase/carbamoylase family amidase [Candidatus Dormibacteraeota bacterium]
MSSHEDAAVRAITKSVLQDIEEIATLSKPGKGVTRLAYSAEDMRARDWFKGRCEEIGLGFGMDAVGNCFASTPSGSSKGALLMGSHLDSVVEGGRFDGVLGVVLALALARHFAHQKTAMPMIVASFACEESTRFGFGSIGSRFFVGELTPPQFPSLVDSEGRSLPEVLSVAEVAPSGDDVKLPKPSGIHAYLEVHIDQGAMLTSIPVRLGIVTNIAGVQRIAIRWIGEAAHSGARARAQRRDALIAASEFIVSLNRLWREMDPDGDRLAVTVGRLTVHPNSPNTVPGEVDLVVDLRADHIATMRLAYQRLREIADGVAATARCGLEWRELGIVEPTPMSPDVIALLEAESARGGAHSTRCVSLTGHDAIPVGRVIPAGMVLLANPSGVSHTADESVDPLALAECVKLLLRAIPALVAEPVTSRGATA